jgi:hypothetical protein
MSGCLAGLGFATNAWLGTVSVALGIFQVINRPAIRQSGSARRTDLSAESPEGCHA